MIYLMESPSFVCLEMYGKLSSLYEYEEYI